MSAPQLWAQTKTLEGERTTSTATVEAIESSTRTVTLKLQNGEYKNIVVPDGVTRFSEIKVGDTLRVTYYDNIVLRLKPAGEAAQNSGELGITSASGAKPGGTVGVQRTITATITAIDRKVPSITLVGPNNWKYSSKVEDKKALDKVKVGDKLDITWTEAMLIGFDKVQK